MKQGKFPDWEEFYQEKGFEAMPWFHPALDPDLERSLSELRVESGRALDLGTGPGTQAIALAERGFEVTATDISATAVVKAAEAAAGKGLNIDFRQDDIRESMLDGAFDFVFDRGCLNVLPVPSRPGYVCAVERLIRPKGYLFLKSIRLAEDSGDAARHFTPSLIEGLLSRSFTLISLKETVMQGTLTPPPPVYFSVHQRV